MTDTPPVAPVGTVVATAAAPDATAVVVPMTPWYKSRGMWIGITQFIFFLAVGLESAIKAGNSVSIMLLAASALGALQSTIKALAPNIITGLAVFDGPPKPQDTRLP